MSWIESFGESVRGTSESGKIQTLTNTLDYSGYLPPNGVATVAQVISATYQGFGMAQDLAGFSAVYGAIVDGDGTSWSIGGAPHTGIGGSHHNYNLEVMRTFRGERFQESVSKNPYFFYGPFDVVQVSQAPFTFI